MIHRAHGAICLLLLEQMLKQPFRGCRRSFSLGRQFFPSLRHAMQTQFFKETLKKTSNSGEIRLSHELNG